MSRLLVDRLYSLSDIPEWPPDEVYLLVAVAATASITLACPGGSRYRLWFKVLP